MPYFRCDRNRLKDAAMKTAWTFIAISCLYFTFAVAPRDALAEQTLSLSHRLAHMLVGEYDSVRQMQEDKENNVPKDMSHARINRSFVITDAPAVGDPVVVSTTAYAGNPWHFDSGEFLVWTLTDETTEDVKSVVMSPRRFKDQERRMPFARDGEKLGGFTDDDLETAVSGANCVLVWTPSEDGFSGRSQPCYVMSTTKNKMLNWVWQYELIDDALWISFAGIDENGNVLDGTPKDSPYRLDRRVN